MSPFLWEQHCCLPMSPSAPVPELARYPVGSYLSVNVGYAPQSTAEAVALAESFRAAALADGRFRLVRTLADLADAGEVIALAFDLEDSGPLGGDLDNVARFHALGVRSLAATYNHANAAGCGCLDVADTGLTGYGRDLVAVLNEVGVFVDGSHCSRRSGLDMAELTAVPMIYSHSNFAALWPHPRNITDEQALACARTGGVIGINGVGIFLGHNAESEAAARVAAMARHIEYGVELVGIDHIGVGSDFSFDGDDFNAEIRANPHNFSADYTRYGPLRWVPPEDLLGLSDIPGLAAVLAGRGFSAADRAAIFGGNFARAARQVWRDPR
ncbi:dipeptidase [Nocardia takedensis]|uniref:dipeptidase n=1 Tax=Nocardia takedensis TaxID=259390 RepID=UPI00030D9B8E|nr:membrane dipeptidase [Nocardia takedensis]